MVFPILVLISNLSLRIRLELSNAFIASWNGVYMPHEIILLEYCSILLIFLSLCSHNLLV